MKKHSVLKLDKEWGERPRGETFVWATAMGLCLGLLMVFFLFGLIAYNGLSVFWPRDVVEIVIEDDNEDGPKRIAGIFHSTQQRTERLVKDNELIPSIYTEERFFIGNRDVYGQSFQYFRSDEIVQRSYPDELMVMERREWGDALVYPSHIESENDKLIHYDHHEFDAIFERLVQEAQDRRSELNQIDRHEIGSINFKMRDIDLELRYYQQKETLDNDEQERVNELQARRDELQKDYQELEHQANQLRRKQRSNHLHYELASGEQDSIAIGDIYSYHYPNQANFFQKLGIFASSFYSFLSGYPREANTQGGIYPAIFGTFIMTLIMSLAVTPFGVIAAVYLREYARQGPLVRAVRISVNNLAGVPSIVFGVFGLGFFVYLIGGSIDQLFFSRALPTPTFGTGGILWAGLTLALLNVPVVIVATEEALAAVSRGVREGALACGASKWQTIQSLVLPASLPGILTGLVLAMARGAGEVAPLMLVGVVALAPNLPVDGNFPFIHLERSFMHLGFHIYDLGFQSPDSEAAIPMVFATTLVLIGLVVVLNLSAILLRNHIRKKYRASAF